MNKLDPVQLSNQIFLFKEIHPSCLFITRRRYSLTSEISHYHQTYHSFIDKNWRTLRSRYSESSDSMPDVIKSLKPSNLLISDDLFYSLFRDSLNGDLTLFNLLPADTFQELSETYDRIMNGLDYEDVLVSAEYFLRNTNSTFPFLNKFSCLVIPDYYLLLENEIANANSISFLRSLSNYCSIHHLQVFTYVDNHFISIQ